MKRLLIALLGLSVSLSAQGKEEDRLRACATVLKEIIDIPDDIPRDLLDKAECVVVFPDVKKFAVGVGGTYGRGAMTCRTGDTFTGVVTRWALANWVSDLPGFSAPAVLKYDSWKFRTTYASLHAQDAGNFPKTFPLTPPTSAGRSVTMTGTLRAGSGVYMRAFQNPSAPGFTLLFSNGSGGPLDPNNVPRLTVIRVR